MVGFTPLDRKYTAMQTSEYEYTDFQQKVIFIPKSHVRPNLKPSYSLGFICKNLYRLGATQPKIGKILRFLDFICCFYLKLTKPNSFLRMMFLYEGAVYYN